MVFADLLKTNDSDVGKAVDELFAAAQSNQHHPQDLLLVDQHAFHDPELGATSFLIGPGMIGWAEQTFYKFIDWYRQSHMIDRSTFIQDVQTDPQVAANEILMLQVELSIYVRFWESDFLIKQLVQVTNLAAGKPYDWYLSFPTNTRSKNKTKAQSIRQLVRDRMKNTAPLFYGLIDELYSGQLRNAFAHSQFYIDGRSIGLLNFSSDPKNHAPLRGISIDNWYTKFHRLLLLHNHLIRSLQQLRDQYKQETLANGNRIGIVIHHENGNVQTAELGVRHDRDEWLWHDNLNDDDLRQAG